MSKSALSPINEGESRQPSSLLGAVGPVFYPLALLGRLPFAMTVVGVLTLVFAVTGSLSDAGATSAMVGVGTALVGPVWGIGADRFGQRPILLVCAVLHAAALLGLVALTYAHAPLLALVSCAFAMGATAPQMAAMSRARLMAVINTQLPQSARLGTLNKSMSVESTADELVFVFGPVAVGVLAVSLGDWSPLVIAAALTLVCVVGFALHPTARLTAGHTSSAHEVSAPVRDVFRGPLLVLAGAMAAIGWFFGAMLTSLTAFMDTLGKSSSAGVVYGAMGVGSAVLALSVAWFSPRFSHSARLVVFSTIALVGVVWVPFVSSIAQMTVVLVVIGIGLGPCLVTVFSLGSLRAPHGRASTVMTLLSSAVVVGQSISTAYTGRVVEVSGLTYALVLPIVAIGTLGVLSILNARLFGVRERPSQL